MEEIEISKKVSQELENGVQIIKHGVKDDEFAPDPIRYNLIAEKRNSVNMNKAQVLNQPSFIAS